MATNEGAAPAAAGGVVRDGMHCEFDVAIPMDDGVVLRADVFRPPGPGPWPPHHLAGLHGSKPRH